jgi:hypothetical protein
MCFLDELGACVILWTPEVRTVTDRMMGGARERHAMG